LGKNSIKLDKFEIFRYFLTLVSFTKKTIAV
jgi:hypothetical protein